MTLTDLSPLANHLWQSSLCAAGVWLLSLAHKKNRAAVRYWLWLAASVKFLIPFSLLIGAGGQIPWRTAAPAVIAQPQWSSVVEQIGQPFIASVPEIQVAAQPASSPLPAILFGVWLCGFAVSVVFWLRCWRQICAARRHAAPLPFGLPIPVMSSPARVEPGVVGICKPVLLLPKGIEDRLTPDQMNAVLAHELSHVRRRDNLTAAIHMIVEAVLWFYPLVWWIRARLVEERERACDEAVLQAGSDAEAYAEGILNVCKFYVESPLACVSGISGADLKKRIVRIMTQSFADELTFGRKLLLAAVAVVAAAGPVLCGMVIVQRVSAQTPIADWQAAAGGKMAFEVASIRQNTSEEFVPPLFPLSSDDSFSPTGGLFSADFSLPVYIEFAYKLSLTPEQQDSIVAHLPKWVATDRFEIHARAAGTPTKDQMRLMMQSLLADRFKLAIHFENQQVSVLALVLAKPGKLGPKLLPHALGPSCDLSTTVAKGPPANGPELFPAICDTYAAEANGDHIKMGSRNTTLPLIAATLPSIGRLGFPVIDRTGLSGRFDFTLQWTPESNNPRPSGQDTTTGLQGPTFQQALREQLGLKLESQKGPVEILVIDHIEKPSEN